MFINTTWHTSACHQRLQTLSSHSISFCVCPTVGDPLALASRRLVSANCHISCACLLTCVLGFGRWVCGVKYRRVLVSVDFSYSQTKHSLPEEACPASPWTPPSSSSFPHNTPVTSLHARFLCSAHRRFRVELPPPRVRMRAVHAFYGSWQLF